MSNTETQRKLQLSQAVIYAFGYFGVYLIAFSVGQIPQIFYVPETGSALISPLSVFGGVILGNYLFGLLNGLGRIVDGVVDPWIGNLSDYCRSRFGRRKPFLVIGPPLMGVFFVLFTLPPSTEPSILNLLWLLFIYPVFFLFFTVAITPYLAMIPEIARTSKERLLVTTLQSIFLIMGTFAGVFIIGAIPESISFTTGAIMIAVLSCIPLLLVAIFVRIPDEPCESEIPDRPGTLKQIKEALQFRPFRIYLFSIIAFFFGFEMLKSSARYVAVHLFGDVGAYTIILGLALGVAAISGIGAYWLGRKIGKRKSMILMSVMFIILLPFVGLVGKGFLHENWTGYLLFALMGLPVSILLVVPNSLLADIIDMNNDQSGKKREALFFASQALLNKVGIAFSKMSLNFLLPVGALAGSAVGESGVRLVGPIASVFVFIGLLIFLRFPDIEKKS